MSSFERENRVVFVALTSIAAAAYTTNGFKGDELSQRIIDCAHLSSFSIFFGSSVWTTFVSGIVLFKTLPRHTFGIAQSKLFPRYFQLSALTLGITTAASYISYPLTTTHLAVLGAANIAGLLNLFWLEPTTTKVMFERHVVEKELGEGMDIGVIAPKSEAAKNDPRLRALSKRFGMLHGISSLLNLTALCGGVFHLWFLAGKLVHT